MASNIDDVLRTVLHSCYSLIGKKPYFLSVTNGLIGAGVITLEEVASIKTQQNLSDADRGDRIVELLGDKMKFCAVNKKMKLVNDICVVFESRDVNNEFLKGKATEIRSKLKEISTTPVPKPQSQMERGVEDTDGTTQEPQGENGDEDTDSAGEPPEWTDNPKKYEKEDMTFTDDLTQDIKFLLMPATPAEEEKALLYLEPKDESSDKYIKTSVDDIPLYIGKYGKHPVIVAKTAPAKDRQGPADASIVATTILTKIKSIEYVVAVGVCFGINRKKQHLGDVVISSIICDFTSKREGTTESNTYPQGAQDSVGDKILNIFTLPHYFKMPHEKEVHIGPVISTSNLIANDTVKASLVDSRREAVGGEMEGAAINKAVKRKSKATCIIIKGIGDWGDSTKGGSKKWKPYAARAAAYYVKTALNEFPSD